MRRTNGEHNDNGRFRPGNPLTGVRGTRVDAEWLNGVQEEIVNVILAAGLEPDGSSERQLVQAIQTMSSPSFANLETASRLAAFVPADSITVRGHTVDGEGTARYRRVAAGPKHLGAFQDTRGDWWEIAATEVTPMMFGARGDGYTDDTAAIRAMIDYCENIPNAVQNYGGAVYGITSQGEKAYILPFGGDSFVAVGDRQINIRVLDGSPTYRGIFGPKRKRAMSRIELRDLGIDKNSQNARYSYGQNLEATGRYAITTYGGAWVGTASVTGCTFANSDAVVDVYLPEPASGTEVNGQVEVSRNTWIATRLGGNGADYDQSIINVAGEQGVIDGNSFTGESWERAPRTAIETHLGSCRVSNNVIDKYQVGCNIGVGTRHGVQKANGLAFVNNTVKVSRSGVYWWPTRFKKPPPGDITGSDVTIADNTIHMHWREYRHGLARLGALSSFIGTNSADIERVSIIGNRVSYDPENPSAPALDRRGQPKAAAAIEVIATYNPDLFVDGLTIERNVVQNAPCPALLMAHGKLRNVLVRGNQFTNCRTASTNVAAVYQGVVSMDVGLLASTLTFADNVIADNLPWPYPKGVEPIYLRNRANNRAAWLFSNTTFLTTHRGLELIEDYHVEDGALRIMGGYTDQDIGLPPKAAAGSRFTTTAGERVKQGARW